MNWLGICHSNNCDTSILISMIFVLVVVAIVFTFMYLIIFKNGGF
jgi:hypothetical protein